MSAENQYIDLFPDKEVCGKFKKYGMFEKSHFVWTLSEDVPQKRDHASKYYDVTTFLPAPLTDEIIPGLPKDLKDNEDDTIYKFNIYQNCDGWFTAELTKDFCRRYNNIQCCEKTPVMAAAELCLKLKETGAF